MTKKEKKFFKEIVRILQYDSRNHIVHELKDDSWAIRYIGGSRNNFTTQYLHWGINGTQLQIFTRKLAKNFIKQGIIKRDLTDKEFEMQCALGLLKEEKFYWNESK